MLVRVRAVKRRKEGNGQIEEIFMRLSQRDAMADWMEGVSGGGGVHRDVPASDSQQTEWEGG